MNKDKRKEERVLKDDTLVDGIKDITGENPKPKCGIIMPIAAIDDCSMKHWEEVLAIITEVINSAGFFPNIVSNAEDSGIIHKRIVQNIYHYDLVICDVSCKNSNVMFELGMRLAFDKPTILIKDEVTGYSFDTGIIEHLLYPRSLSYYDILKFKENLKKKIIGTFDAAKDPRYSTFLKQFGEFTVAKIESKELTKEDFILQQLKDIQSKLDDKDKNETISKVNSSNFRYMHSSKINEEFIRDCLLEYMGITGESLGNLSNPSTMKKFINYVTNTYNLSGKARVILHEMLENQRKDQFEL